MGIPYETFLILFGLAMFTFGAMTQAQRRATSTLYGRALAHEGQGRLFITVGLVGGVTWLPLMVLGFMSISWYLVLGMFLIVGSAGGIGYTMLTVRPGRDPGMLHHTATGVLGASVIALTVYLWSQRLM